MSPVVGSGGWVLTCTTGDRGGTFNLPGRESLAMKRRRRRGERDLTRDIYYVESCCGICSSNIMYITTSAKR